MFGWFKRRRRRRILQQPWSDRWTAILHHNVRLTRGLDDDEWLRLRERTKIFVAEKNWEGIRGYQVTEEMKVTIAGGASLMLLGVEGFYFDNVQTVLIQPRGFRGRSSDGLVVDEDAPRAGEAWLGGPIILSWPDVIWTGRNDDDACNLVIHEFAHALDGLDGSMGGNLLFDNAQTSARWESVLKTEFQALCEAKYRGDMSLLDYYGTVNEAEFFAVASETFFEQPRLLSQWHPELSELLREYYKLDPSRWQRN
ncbi:MAG: M90 family metallopeptidase [Planctomycetota bacterium]